HLGCDLLDREPAVPRARPPTVDLRIDLRAGGLQRDVRGRDPALGDPPAHPAHAAADYHPAPDPRVLHRSAHRSRRARPHGAKRHEHRVSARSEAPRPRGPDPESTENDMHTSRARPFRSDRLAFRAAAVVGLLLVLSTEGTAGRLQPEKILLHKKNVLVTSEWVIDGREFELLGRVGAKCRSISLTESDRDLGVRCSGSLISPALQLGADAVVGLHVLPTPFTESDLSSKFASGVSGMAVRPL